MYGSTDSGRLTGASTARGQDAEGLGTNGGVQGSAHEASNVLDFSKLDLSKKPKKAKSTGHDTERELESTREKGPSEERRDSGAKQELSEAALKYREKLRNLAIKYKSLLKDRSAMKEQYETYITELRGKLSKSNEAVKKLRAIVKQQQEHYAAKKSPDVGFSGAFSALNPLDYIKAAVSQEKRSAKGIENGNSQHGTKEGNGPPDSFSSVGEKNPGAASGRTNEIEKLSSEIADLEQRNIRIASQLKNSKAELHSFQSEAQKEADIRRKELAKLASTLKNKENELKGSESKCSEFGALADKLNNKIKIMKEQLDDYSKMKDRVVSMENDLLTKLDVISHMKDDKKILDSQLKQVYKTKRELDKEVRALKDTNIKMKAAQQTHMDSARKVNKKKLVEKQDELDAARTEMVALLHTTEMAEERVRVVEEQNESLTKELLRYQAVALNDLENDADSLASCSELLPIEDGPFALTTPQKNVMGVVPDDVNGTSEHYLEHTAMESMRKRHNSALRQISEQRSQFLLAAAEKAGFQSEMSAMSAKVKLQEIQIDQLKKSQREKDENQRQKQKKLEAKALELVEAAVKRKKELLKTRRALVAMRQSYQKLEGFLQRGEGGNRKVKNDDRGRQRFSKEDKPEATKSTGRKSFYPKTDELGALLVTVENLWEQLHYCEYEYMLSSQRFRAKPRRDVLQVSTKRLENAQHCISSLDSMFRQRGSSLSSLLPINGRKTLSTPMEKLVNLLLCFGNEVVKLRKRVNDYTEALLETTFEKSEAFQVAFYRKKDSSEEAKNGADGHSVLISGQHDLNSQSRDTVPEDGRTFDDIGLLQ